MVEIRRREMEFVDGRLYATQELVNERNDGVVREGAWSKICADQPGETAQEVPPSVADQWIVQQADDAVHPFAPCSESLYRISRGELLVDFVSALEPPELDVAGPDE
jgi:hypothetical protein